MTQSIVIQVGQCGNQIGYRFWDLVLREHGSVNKKATYDEALSSFFEDAAHTTANSLSQITNLKARAVLIDMEEGVLNEILVSRLRDLFYHHQLISSVSGSGNNWAVGHLQYGTQYRESIMEALRRAAEACDCLQSFFILHSMGGGTGSGVGTSVLQLVADEYPEVCRFVSCVYPSADDDVITSPYNSMLAMKYLTDYADCVLPVENQSLVYLVEQIHASTKDLVKQSSAILSPRSSAIKRDERPFDEMNNIVANLMLNMTASSRFQGTLNVDLNEIAANLVPFPKLHYLLATQTPIYSLTKVKIPPRSIDEMFADAFSHRNQLVSVNPKDSTYLACALMARGNVQMSDIRRNIDRLKPKLRFINWNVDGWKVGLCSVPSVDHPHSLLTISNNSAITEMFCNVHTRFSKLYKRKAHVHHYKQVDGFDMAIFEESLESLNSLMSAYRDMVTSRDIVKTPRLKVEGST